MYSGFESYVKQAFPSRALFSSISHLAPNEINDLQQTPQRHQPTRAIRNQFTSRNFEVYYLSCVSRMRYFPSHMRSHGHCVIFHQLFDAEVIMEHMHKLKALSMLENGATVSEEQWVELTGQPAYRVRAELKRNGIEKVTREVALAFIAKRNEAAVLALAAECRKAVNELARNSHHLDMLIELRVKKAEKIATNVVTKAKTGKLPNLKPSIYGNSVYLKELADWAGIRLQTLKERIEETPVLLDNGKIEYTKDLPAEQATILAKGANIIAQALNLEPKK